MGGLAILVGLTWLFGALRTRSQRAGIADTYRATGGPVYTAVQLGCAGVLMLLGITFIVGMVVISRR
jgi:hypothetical protein